jgi:hypothetical protein
MSATADDSALARVTALERVALLRRLDGLLASVVVAELLFSSFAMGHWFGPRRLTSPELLLGAGLALGLGLLGAAITARRRRERGAMLTVNVLEGRRRRRLAVFAEHLTLDGEVVLKDSLEPPRRPAEGRLVLRYRDPRHAGPVLRELEGDEAVLFRLERALAPSRSWASPGSGASSLPGPGDRGEGSSGERS